MCLDKHSSMLYNLVDISKDASAAYSTFKGEFPATRRRGESFYRGNLYMKAQINYLRRAAAAAARAATARSNKPAWWMKAPLNHH